MYKILRVKMNIKNVEKFTTNLVDYLKIEIPLWSNKNQITNK
jgi:hypothetical protein